MTPFDDLNQLAINAGLETEYAINDPMAIFIIAVAKRAANTEREACAKFIEDEYVRQFENPWREDLAAAIRERGKT